MSVHRKNFLKKQAENSDRDYSHFHPSEIGGCPRAIVLKMLGVSGNEDFSGETLTKFSNGHSVHDRIQLFFKNAGLMACDIATEIKEEESFVSFKTNESGNKIYNKKLTVYGKNGNRYPFNDNDKVWIKGKENKIRIKDIKIGDEFYLAEVPFEQKEINLCGHIDAIIYENNEPCVLEIKSINFKGFNRLFYTEDKKDDYVSDIFNDKICNVCGARMEYGESISSHLVEKHYSLAIPEKKHVIQANAYMASQNIDKAIIWYENKDNQNICDILMRSSKISNVQTFSISILYQRNRLRKSTR
jgi:hypothetical protein